MFGTQHSLCCICAAPLANFMHIFWECPSIKAYWQAIASCIRSVTSASIPVSIEVCLLHLVEPLATTRAIRTLLTLLLFYAKKLIILSWKSSVSPTLESWKTLVNKAVPFYKTTYLSRGALNKFEKVWEGWGVDGFHGHGIRLITLEHSPGSLVGILTRRGDCLEGLEISEWSKNWRTAYLGMGNSP